MPYSDTDTDEYDPPLSQQVSDWYQQKASPVANYLTDRLGRNAQSLMNVPSNLYKGLEWASQNVAAPALQQMQQTQEMDWSQQPLIGRMGEHGEFTGRLPALASYLSPYLLGAAPSGPGVLPAGVKLPGKLHGYPEGYEGAYHGTPHTFAPEPENVLGRFRNELMGTGEGHQTYFWGPYLGAARGTAETYVGRPGVTYHGQNWDPYNRPGFSSASLEQPEHLAYRAVRDTDSIDEAITRIETDIKGLEARKEKEGQFYEQTASDSLSTQQRALKFLQTNKDNIEKTSGNLYHVEIKPPEEALLHWDQPITSQPKEIQDKMRPIIEKYLGGEQRNYLEGEPRSAEGWMSRTGGDVYSELRRRMYPLFPDKKGYGGQAASEAMAEAGIPGGRFADNYSRPIVHVKGEIERINANMERMTKELDDINSGVVNTDPLSKTILENGLMNARANIRGLQNKIKDVSTLVVDGKPIEKFDDIYKVADPKSRIDPRERAMSELFQAKDVDKAIARLKEVMRVSHSQIAPSTIRNRKAVEWLEQNRDKVSFKEPDITHNYVIFDPKDLNIIHREKALPKGYI